MKEIILASHNKGKIEEFELLLKEYDVQLKSLYDFKGLDEVEETGETFYANAQLKAETIGEKLNKPVIADDSGLMIDALDGRPGVYSARYAGDHGDDVANYEKVLEEMKGIDENNRTAKFVSVLAFYRPGQEIVFKEGICEGEITFGPRGKRGFGYDPIFIPKGYTKTMAQLTQFEKNFISHRAEALHQFKKWLKANDL